MKKFVICLIAFALAAVFVAGATVNTRGPDFSKQAESFMTENKPESAGAQAAPSLTPESSVKRSVTPDIVAERITNRKRPPDALKAFKFSPETEAAGAVKRFVETRDLYLSRAEPAPPADTDDFKNRFAELTTGNAFRGFDVSAYARAKI